MQAAAKGHWAHITNIHLAQKWMPSLVTIVKGIAESQPHSDFRLWLSMGSGQQIALGLSRSCMVVALERPQVHT